MESNDVDASPTGGQTEKATLASYERDVFGPKFWRLLSSVVAYQEERGCSRCYRLIEFVSFGNDVVLAQKKSEARAFATAETRLLGKPRPARFNFKEQHSPGHAQPCASPMSTYALQTKTMLQSVSNSPIKLLGQATRRDDSKAPLPSKRKRDDICGLGTSTKPFTIKPYLNAPHNHSASFKPVRVIGRSQLPLTFLDTTPDETFAPNSLFSANIEILEQDGVSDGEMGPPKVLIARLEAKGTLYAIERVQARVYSSCRLASWLKEKEVAHLWDPLALTLLATPARSTTDADTAEEWWQHAVVETQPGDQLVKRARLTMMRLKQQEKVPNVKPPQQPCDSVPQTSIPLSTTTIEAPLEALPELPSPDEQLTSFVQQYLDAVYLSKTSLAYLAKGPVTRLRNAFISPLEGAPQTHKLVTFLRAMLLSHKAGEKKYYEKLPSLIKAMPPGSFSDEELTAATTKTKKSTKKMKLSRDGIYPQEELAVKKWWLSEVRSGESVGVETIDQRIKRRIGELRVRETLAQLILMLEIVALEALSTYKPPPEDVPAEDATHALDGSGTKPKKRKRKLDDINLQLDLLLDKLCIWHATEEAGILDFDAKPLTQTEGADGTGRNGASDRLHSFCVEVIIPFYMNRLPEQALMVNKKLGGPAHHPPSKRKAMKPPTTSRKSEGSKEPEAKKARRSLAGVATDNTGKTIERVTPSLSRSATDSMLLNGIKRERSEVPLSAIPFQRSPSKGARQSMSQIRHLQGRQIDLAQPSAAATAKLKQKQRVEEDLQDAILALKKPNRGLAAGSYVAEIEKRGLGSITKSRKPANPVRKVVKDVQVTATPRVGRRTKNMIEQTPSRHQHDPFVRLPTSEVPPSSGFWIPSSTARPPSSTVPATAHRSVAAGRGLVHPNIAETPCKAPNTKTFLSGAARRTIFTTPSKVVEPFSDVGFTAPSHVFETPAKPTESSPPPNPNLIAPTIAATPTKSIGTTSKVTGSLAFSAAPKEDVEASIYDALGWNDDDDELL
jgi:DNA replication regulator SLD3